MTRAKRVETLTVLMAEIERSRSAMDRMLKEERWQALAEQADSAQQLCRRVATLARGFSKPDGDS